jgi:hypothetical protein
MHRCLYIDLTTDFANNHRKNNNQLKSNSINIIYPFYVVNKKFE